MMFEVTGIDVSKWQKEINWGLALGQGISFAFIRSSEGDRQVDAYFERSMEETARRGIPRGISHTFRPGRDWKSQSDLFSELIRSHEFELEAVVDVKSHDGLDREELNGVLGQFIEHSESSVPRPLMIRTSPGFFNKHLPKTDYAWKRRLWTVNWTKAVAPLVPDEWSSHNKGWTFWQHSSKKNSLGADYGVATKSVGLNRFNGDREQFMEMYGLTGLLGSVPLPDPEPPPGPDLAGGTTFEVISSALHVFSAPRLDAAILGDLREGDRVRVKDLAGTGEVWVQTAQGGWCLYTCSGVQLMRKANEGA